MVQYKIVNNYDDAKQCDNLLTELIMSEKKYDSNIKETFVVNNYYTEIYNKENNVLICSVSGDEIVGFVYGYLKEQAGELLYENVGLIDALYVRDNYRKQGIATYLINEFYKWCDLKNIKYIEIGSFVENKDAYNLYKKLGFEVVSYRMKKIYSDKNMGETL